MNPIPVACMAVLVAMLTWGPFAEAQQQPRSTGTTSGARSTSGANRSGTSSAGVSSGRSTGLSGSMLGGSSRGGRSSTRSGQGNLQPDLQTFGIQDQSSRTGFARGSESTFGNGVNGGQGPGSSSRQFGGLGGNRGNFGGAFGNSGFGFNNTMQAPVRGQTSTRSRASQLRPQHRVSFSVPPVNSSGLTSRLQSQLQPLQVGGRLQGVQHSLSADGTVTLRGSAASLEDANLAAALMRLEPGVRHVDNQLVVPESGSASSALAPNFP